MYTNEKGNCREKHAPHIDSKKEIREKRYVRILLGFLLLHMLKQMV